MRNTFKLSILVVAMAMAGCSSQSKPVELGTVAPQSQYDDYIQDALGVQRYSEAQMLAQRKFSDFQDQLNDLEEKRRALDAALNARAYESGQAEAPGSSAEAGRIGDYQAASRASQARVAEASSRLTIQQSLIENQRDQALLAADREAAKKIAAVQDQDAKDLAAAEERLKQDIEGRRSIDSAARLEASKQFEEQRFALAVANADAERQAKSRLDDEIRTLQRLRSEAAGRAGHQEARIAELRRQIAEIEQSLIQTGAADATLLASQEARIASAQAEVDRLASVAQQLKSSTVSAGATLVGPSSEFVQVKEAELSRLRSATEVRTARRIDDIKAALAEQKTGIVSRARTEIATLSADTELTKARVVAPVVTGRAVYTGEVQAQRPLPSTAPVPKALTIKQPSAPVLTVNRFEPKTNAAPTAPSNDEIGGAVLSVGSGVAPPKPQGSAAPLVVAAKTRSIFDVYYVYKDEASWTKFQNYLKAYGITDFEPTHNNRDGEFLIYCGRYYDDEQAASRVAFLNSTTNTKHVQVRETQVPL